MATAGRAAAASAQVSTEGDETLAAALAMIAGYVDAYGYLTFKTYLSFMSGNTTQTGFLTGQGDVAAAMPSLLAIVSFLFGVFTGTSLTCSGTHRSWRVRFGVVAALLPPLLTLLALAVLGRRPERTCTRQPVNDADATALASGNLGLGPEP